MIEMKNDKGRSDEMHRLRADLRGLRTEMKGLNPGTSSYKQLVEKANGIIKQLEQMGADPKVCPECQFEASLYPHEKFPHQRDCSQYV